MAECRRQLAYEALSLEFRDCGSAIEFGARKVEPRATSIRFRRECLSLLVFTIAGSEEDASSEAPPEAASLGRADCQESEI